jgi:hypothetical protein
MRCIAVLGLVLATLATAPEASAQEAESITWSKDLPTALEEAKESERVLMVCINAKYVDGREEQEPAAKGLREVVYEDPRVIEKSRDFVCVLLTKEGSSDEYDALRELGIEGTIISPQHVFVAPEGDRILHRHEYWSFGTGETAVEMLIQMMSRAQSEWKDPGTPPPAAAAGGDGEAAPEDGSARAEWIADRLKEIDAGVNERDRALGQLVAADRDGDCTTPLLELLPKYDEDVSTLRALVRALGRDGLHSAAPALVELLKHKDDSIKANAAVSLEYVGSPDKKVIAALRKVATKWKDVVLANHAYRALGRCGREDAKVRSLLLKQAGSAKSEFASYGPCIGLAYFEGDEKAMRGVEKILKVIGIPGSRRGGGQNSVKRGLVSWTLAAIGDGKSGEFLRDEMAAGLENVRAFWVEGLRNYWILCAEVCEGERDRLPEVEAGVRIFVRFARDGNLERYGAESRGLMDEARRGREASGFTPMGDNVLNAGD